MENVYHLKLFLLAYACDIYIWYVYLDVLMMGGAGFAIILQFDLSV